jgi:hypothetical protein
MAGNLDESRRIVVKFTISPEHIDELAAATAEIARNFIEFAVDIDSESDEELRSIAIHPESRSAFVHGLLDDLRVKAAAYLREHLKHDFEEYLRTISLPFEGEECIQAFVSVMIDDWNLPDWFVRKTRSILFEDLRKKNRSLLASRRKLPRGAPPGERVPGLNEQLRKEYREIQEKSDKRIGKKTILLELSKKHGISPDSIDARLWPRSRKRSSVKKTPSN